MPIAPQKSPKVILGKRQEPSSGKTGAPIRRICALVADDNPGVREVMAKGLELVGFSVHRVENGEQAYIHFVKNGCDLVVTDLEMPVMNGITLIKKLKVDSPETPIILVSGQFPEDLSTLVDPITVVTALTKPIPLKVLQQAALDAVEVKSVHVGRQGSTLPAEGAEQTDEEYNDQAVSVDTGQRR